MDTLGIRIIKMCSRENITTSDLAKKIGMPRSTMSQILSDQNYPQVKTVIRFCKALKCSSDYLLGLRDSP